MVKYFVKDFDLGKVSECVVSNAVFEGGKVMLECETRDRKFIVDFADQHFYEDARCEKEAKVEADWIKAYARFTDGGEFLYPMTNEDGGIYGYVNQNGLPKKVFISAKKVEIMQPYGNHELLVDGKKWDEGMKVYSNMKAYDLYNETKTEYFDGSNETSGGLLNQFLTSEEDDKLVDKLNEISKKLQDRGVYVFLVDGGAWAVKCPKGYSLAVAENAWAAAQEFESRESEVIDLEKINLIPKLKKVEVGHLVHNTIDFYGTDSLFIGKKGED